MELENPPKTSPPSFDGLERQLHGWCVEHPIDHARLRRDVLDMRGRILASQQRSANSPGATTFDVKHSRGGVIDLEFIVQFLILGRGEQHPSLIEVGDNDTALIHASTLGLIPTGLAGRARPHIRPTACGCTENGCAAARLCRYHWKKRNCIRLR
jgi:glutamine synthetase adenylyltransferase